MSTHHFLTDTLAHPPVTPPLRWLDAFNDGQAANWGQVQAAKAGDVVWVSVGYPTWADAVARLLAAKPRVRVVVLSPVPDQAEGLQAINIGARGYCHLFAVPELLQDVATVVEQGGLWVGPELVDRIVAATRDLLQRSPAAVASLPAADVSLLSARELEVAQAVAVGKSNREVAEQLFIAERTVKAHLGSVFEKLGVRDRLQLALRLAGRADASTSRAQP
jgi:two-component system nitrate/nitrite response regulator NarL